MEDELEPFRKAAELGCPDFFLSEHKSVWLRQAEWISGYMMDEAQKYTLPCLESNRINRYAAAVCAEWWHERCEQMVWQDGFEPDEVFEQACKLTESARAFGKKYGGG